MLIKEEYLVIINAKNRIQRVLLKLEQDAVSKVFKISRITGQYGGKETKQPELLIDKGKELLQSKQLYNIMLYLKIILIKAMLNYLL